MKSDDRRWQQGRLAIEDPKNTDDIRRCGERSKMADGNWKSSKMAMERPEVVQDGDGVIGEIEEVENPRWPTERPEDVQDGRLSA